MKKCPKCGKEYDDTWKNCLNCSVPLTEDMSIKEFHPEIRSKKEKSDGIIILGVFRLLCSIPALLIAGLAAISSGGPDIHIRLPLILSPACFLISARGVLMLKNWARFFTIIICSIMSLVMFLLAVPSLKERPFENLLFLIFSLTSGAVFASIIFYLTRPKVKEQFR